MSQARAVGLRLLFKEFRAVKSVATGALVVLIVSVLATLIGPFLVQYFVDHAVAGSDQSLLITLALSYLVVALVGGTARIASSYLAVQSGWRIADSLRIRLLRHAAVERPVLDVESRPIGSVLEEVEGNADIVGRTIADAGFRMVGNVAVVLGTLVVMMIVVPAAGIGITLLVLGICFLLIRLARRSVRRWESARDQQTKLFGFVGDSLAVSVPLPQPLPAEVVGVADFDVVLGPAEASMVLSLWMNAA